MTVPSNAEKATQRIKKNEETEGYISNKKTKYVPGTICGTKETLSVSTGNGILHIKTLQFGSYMIGDAKSFIKKFKPQIGETLGH